MLARRVILPLFAMRLRDGVAGRNFQQGNSRPLDAAGEARAIADWKSSAE